MLPVLSPSEFVDIFNQTLELTYPVVFVEGELKNFKISKNRWVYFDLVDDTAKIKCFGTVYSLPGPIEDGMIVKITAYPRLHHQFGFSLNFDQLTLSGVGTIKKAQDMLMAKLEKEGLFLAERKRLIPFPPSRIGLITSSQSAAYRDFIKILAARYTGLEIELADVNVQGESAPGHIIKAIDWFNSSARLVDVIVITRGGGDADDLQTFSTERVVRAVSASRIPTMVAIGHEIDVALAELAADIRASTPSNAAELLVPDKKIIIDEISRKIGFVYDRSVAMSNDINARNDSSIDNISADIQAMIANSMTKLDSGLGLLEKLSPKSVLKMGYAIVRSDGKIIKKVESTQAGQSIEIELSNGKLKAEIS